MHEIQAVVFDAYGTLFDVGSVRTACNQAFPGEGEALSKVWRTKQLEYTWLQSLMGRYENFWSVTAAALRCACRSLGLSLDAATQRCLMEEYLTLSAYPDVTDGLRTLSGRTLAIFSNGTPDMLRQAVVHAGLSAAIDAILSVDHVKVYKPAPAAYAVVPAKLGTPREATLFVSANAWDVAGAKSFGFQTVWLNRTGGVFEELGLDPDFEVSRLAEIASLLRS